MSSLQPPTALVTGASSGIGKALALALATKGYRVFGTSRRPDSLPAPLLPLALDAASKADLHRFISTHGQLLTELDVLVNNCGSSLYGDVTRWDPEAIEGSLRLLLEAPVLLTRVALEGMRSRGRGAIVNVSSLAGEFPLPYMSVYSGAKAGLSAFTQSLMLTEKRAEIQLIDFQPGDYRTAFNERMGQPEALDEQERRTWQILERNCDRGPEAERAAADIIRAIEGGRSEVVRSGTLFQRAVAPFGKRLTSAGLRRRLMRWLYRIR